tara:strand:- start:164 stop:805 length:642 start_codon:yes stop_codon:yes gene_type:complete
VGHKNILLDQLKQNYLTLQDKKIYKMRNRILNALFIILMIACTPNVKEELNAVDNEATFKSNVSSFMEFTQHFKSEDVDKVMGMFADSVLWSPPVFNDYEWLEKEAMVETFKNYFKDYENITFTPGINLPNNNTVDGFWGGSNFRSDGSESSSQPSINPNNIRVYGTWNSKHTETGKETFSKWYAIINFNSAGKIVRFNDWFNVDGLEKQIAE